MLLYMFVHFIDSEESSYVGGVEVALSFRNSKIESVDKEDVD